MTTRWLSTGSFEVGLALRWGDARKRSFIVALMLGPRTLLTLWRWWL